MKQHELTDEQWELVEPMIPKKAAPTGRPSRDPQVMLNGVFWILATGAPWRDLPKRFDPHQTVYDYFANWRRDGIFAGILGALQVKLDEDGNIHWELWCVDGANVRAAGAAAGADKKAASGTATSRKTRRGTTGE